MGLVRARWHWRTTAWLLASLAACAGPSAGGPSATEATSARPGHRHVGALPPHVPTVRWGDADEIVVDGAWKLDLGNAVYTEISSGRVVHGSRVQTPGGVPADAAIDRAGRRAAWGMPGGVCVGVNGVDGRDCFTLPQPRRDDAVRIEAAVHRRLARTAAVFWRAPDGCVRWELSAGPERSYRLVHTAGVVQRSYTVRPSGATVLLEGPVDSDGTTERALGCMSSLAVGEIGPDFIEVGGARWFFDETNCLADDRAPVAPACGG